ncbi:MAG: AcvB/VirJ family lysyl-phosphatidylglycerol hydrolase [Sphingomonas sp.]
MRKPRRALWISLVALLVVLAGAAGWLRYIGYLGGPVFFEMSATAQTAPGERGLGVVIVSGDMGFRVGMGPPIAKGFTADGVPVLGVSSLAYFRNRRTPQEVQALIRESVERALKMPNVDHLVLIGQSFGADMLHVGLTGLPADLRARVQLVALVVPTDTVYYQASPAEMLTFSDPDAAALPTARQLTWIRALCVQGAEEKDSLCPRLTQPNMRRVALPGGHYLNYDSDALYRVLHQAVVASDRAPNMSKGNRS